MGWRAAKSLTQLHKQLKPLAPGADPKSFGLKGNAAHTSTSDHTPHDFPGWGNDIVTAADFPKAGDLHPRQVLDSIRQSRDTRVKYGISEGEMFSSYPAHGFGAWTWRPYEGADGHFEHGHLSVVGDVRADDERAWAVGAHLPDNAYPGRVFEVTQPNMRGTDIAKWQQRMKDLGHAITVDGVYGRGSERTCVAFQKAHQLSPDGRVGPKTWAASFS